MAMIGWKRVCGVYVWWCMCGGVYRMVYMRLAMHVTRGPPPYRGLCLLCLLKLGRVIRCVYNCVMAYGTFHYVIMHYQPF